jgi:putative peptide zinc metalloprotease protein
MRFGPTSLRVSSILAKGLRRPRFRDDLRVSEQTFGGKRSFVVKVPETSSYNRYGPTEYELLTLCDGTRTGADVAAAWNERHPDETFSERTVKEFLEGVEPGVWEQSVGERNLAVLERIRDDRKGRLDQSSVLYLTFKAWDPNRTLAKIDPYLAWMFTPGFVIFSVALFIVAAYAVAGDWTRIQTDTASLYSFQNKTAYDLWAFWFLLFGLGAVHEFGHGLTCKHFGGDVHQMGFMLIYFTPAFFTDTTDILLFDRARHRQWVLFAGIWIELVVCALAALGWRLSAAGSIANDLAYKLMLLSGIQGAFLNLNPLIKADGYYALSQFLQIDNMREDSFAFLRACLRKYLLREDIELPAATRRLRRVFATFGIAAVTYSVSLVTIVLLFVKNVFVSKFGDWGYVLLAALIFFFARKGVSKALPQVRAWWRERRESLMAWKITRAQRASALCVAVLFLIPPIPSRVASDFVLEPGQIAHLRAQTPGILQHVFVHQGDSVKAGDTLAVLANPEVEATAKTLAEQLAMSSSDLRAAQETPDGDKAAAALTQQTRLQREWTVAQQKVEALEIRAPFAGVVSTPLVDQKVGQYISAGDEICELVDRSTMKARILVRDWELEDVSPGAEAQLKASSFAYRTYSGRVEQILPAASLDRPVAQPQRLEQMGQDLTNYFAVVMAFPNSDGSLIEGMTGTAKIAGKDRPLAWQVGRGAWRWFRSQVW